MAEKIMQGGPPKAPAPEQPETSIVLKPSEGERWTATFTGGPFSAIDMGWVNRAIVYAYENWRRKYSMQKAMNRAQDAKELKNG